MLSWYPFDLPSLAVNYTLTEVISNEQRLFFDLPDMPNQFSGEITFSDTGVATEEMLNVLVFVSLTSLSRLLKVHVHGSIYRYISKDSGGCQFEHFWMLLAVFYHCNLVRSQLLQFLTPIFNRDSMISVLWIHWCLIFRYSRFTNRRAWEMGTKPSPVLGGCPVWDSWVIHSCRYHYMLHEFYEVYI